MGLAVEEMAGALMLNDMQQDSAGEETRKSKTDAGERRAELVFICLREVGFVTG